MHERDAAGRESSLHDQRVPGRDEDLGDRRGVASGDGGRHRQQLALVDGAPLRVAAAAHDGHDRLVRLELGDSSTELDDVAGELHAGDVEGATAVDELRTGIAASTLQQVGPIERRRRDLDDHLVGSGRRLGHIGDAEHLRFAVRLEDDRPHGDISRTNAISRKPGTGDQSRCSARSKPSRP